MRGAVAMACVAGILVSAGVAAVGRAPVRAQGVQPAGWQGAAERPGRTPGRADADGGAWLYPRDARRDPSAAPEELYRTAARAGLRVRAIMMDPEAPGRSTAVVLLTGTPPVRAVVRAGDRVGGYRITRIEHDRVVAVLRALGAERAVIAPADSSASPSSSNP